MSDASALDLVNAARAHLGCQPIASFAETTIGGVEALALYNAKRDFLLAAYPWQFTRQLTPLSRLDGPAPDSGYAYAYQLPSDRLGPPERLHVSARDRDSTLTDFAAIGDQIHCDAETLFATIHMRLSPLGWPAAFREAARVALAADLALSIMSDRNAHEALYRVAFGTPSEQGQGGLVRLAITQDARTAPVKRINTGRNPMTQHYGGW